MRRVSTVDTNKIQVKNRIHIQRNNIYYKILKELNKKERQTFI